jgi:hypothetical protein
MLYNDIIGIYAKAGRNAFGEREWGATQDIKARVTTSSKEVIDVSGDKKLADIEVWTNNDTIEIGQKITYESQDYLVVQVFKVRDERGAKKATNFLCTKYGSS